MKTGDNGNIIQAKFLITLLAVTVLLGMAGLWYLDKKALTDRRPSGADQPPTVEFTWTPLGPTTLQEFKGRLAMKDDHSLDFKTYRFHIVELDKTLDMPIDGLVGSDYESDVYLSLLADDPRTYDLDRLTLEISIADDKGQRTSITRVVRLKPPPDSIELKAS